MRIALNFLVIGLSLSAAVAFSADRPKNLPIYFEENRGQFPANLKYSGRAGNLSIGVNSSQTVVRLNDGKRSASVEFQLRGGSGNAAVTGESLTDNKTNYFIGNDESKWRRDVPNFLKVRQAQVYPGIDAVFYGNEHALEYDFVIAPGADPRAISWSIEGADSVSLDKQGQLHIRTAAGEIVEHAPIAYQGTKTVRTRFNIAKNGLVSFAVGKYDRSRPLTIDPVLTYSSYFGGSNADNISGLAVDTTGALYLTGMTSSSDFPVTSGAYKTSFDLPGYNYAFVSKVTPAGNALSYSTFIGPVDYNNNFPVIAVDSFGSAYITGTASTLNYPTTAGAYKTASSYSNVFLTKLNAAGNALAYSTLIGPGTPATIAVDPTQQIAYVAGSSSNSTYPTTAGVFQPALAGSNGNSDAFITAVSSTGSSLIFSTFLGGTGNDSATKLVLDPAGQPVVSGNTIPVSTATQSDFPTTAGTLPLPSGKGQKVFIAKFSKDGTKLLLATLFGGSGAEFSGDMALDSFGNFYIAGGTTSTDLPVTSTAFEQSLDVGFVAKISADAKSISYATYFYSGSPYYTATQPKIAVDSSGRAILAGIALSNFIPTYDAIQSGGGTLGISVLDPTGSYLTYATYLGNGFNLTNIAVDVAGDVYIAGNTQSFAFPVLNAYQKTLSPAASYYTTDGFYAKIKMDNTVCYSSIATTPLSFSSTGGLGTLNVTAPSGCVWVASATGQYSYYNSPFLTNTTNFGTVVGSAAITFTVPKNFSVTPRSMGIQVGNQTVQILQASAVCTMSLSPSTTPVYPGGGGLSNIYATTPSGCSWVIVSDSSWVTPTITSGNYYYSNSTSSSGSASVRYVVAANNGPARTASLTIGGIPIVISQQASTSSVDTTTFSFDANTGTGSIKITVPSNTAWTAAAFDPWIAIVSGASGTGPGIVNFSVTPNTFGIVRVSAIKVANQTVSITQRQTQTLFADILPADAFFDGANLLRTLGITGGCAVNPLKFCPNDNVTNGQMAVFIVRAVMGGDNFTYSSTQHFSDVPPTHIFYTWIQKLYDLGYSTGCGSGFYCPDTNLTRGSAATLLIKGRWTGLNPYFYYNNVFTDVLYGDVNASYIQALRDEGITAGCSVTQFCPTGLLTRGQAAVLLVRALYNQLLPGNAPIITSVSPNVLPRGQTTSVIVTGINALLYPSQFGLGGDITFGAATATSATTMTLPVTVAATAALGPRSITNGNMYYSNPSNVLIGPNMITVK